LGKGRGSSRAYSGLVRKQSSRVLSRALSALDLELSQRHDGYRETVLAYLTLCCWWVLS
jgi:hypothetical protein